MNYNEISSFIWGTADLLRNTYKQHEYGGIILPLYRHAPFGHRP